MPTPVQSFHVEIAGSPLPEALKDLLVSGYVDDSLNVPDMFLLQFRDPDRTVLKDFGVEIGKKVTIKIISDEAPGGNALITNAEITALETEFDQHGTITTVRGLDQAHRLVRGRGTHAYKNMSYSDVATRVAQRNSLTTGKIDSTDGVLDLISQVNTSDYQFLGGLAREVGYEVVVYDGKMDFRKGAKAAGAPTPGHLTSTDPKQLVLGDNLLRFRCSVTSAEQVADVKVQSWDPKQKQAILGTAPASAAGIDIGVTPAELAGKFGGPSHIATNIPLATQAECTQAAQSLAEEIGGSFATFDGVARGNVQLKAGALVSLGGVGKPFEGKYKLTTTRHNFDAEEGYTTWFTVSGRKDSSLLYLASSGGSANGSASGKPIPGVVQAIVTNAKDPEHLSRVKVKFPWLSSDYESDWVRTVQLWAGNGYGAVITPEVGDEVLVAFEQGDLRRPYLLGGLYNGTDKPKDGLTPTVDDAGKIVRRDFFTPKGHQLSFTEKSGGPDAILLKTSDGGYVLNMDQQGKKITISAAGEIEIDATGSTGKITIKADQDLNIEAMKISMKAKSGIEMDGGGGNVEMKGIEIKAQGSAQVSVKGAMVSISADAQAELKGGAMVSVQGALVKIN